MSGYEERHTTGTHYAKYVFFLMRNSVTINITLFKIWFIFTSTMSIYHLD